MISVVSTSFSALGGASVAAAIWSEALGQALPGAVVKRAARPSALARIVNRTERALLDPFMSSHWSSPSVLGLGNPFDFDMDTSDLHFMHWINHSACSLSAIDKVVDRTIWFAHDEWLLLGIGHYEEPVLRAVEPLVARLRDHKWQRAVMPSLGVVAPSSWLAERFISRGLPAWRVAVIPTPLAEGMAFSQDVRDAARSRWLIPNEADCVGWVGDLAGDARKAPDRAVAALAAALDQQPNLYVIVAGNAGPLSAHSRVRSERLPHAQMRDFYCAADFLLFTTNADNLPQVPLEAQACGVQVLVEDRGGTVETLFAQGATAVPKIAPSDFIDWLSETPPLPVSARSTVAIPLRFKAASAAAHFSLFAAQLGVDLG